MKSFVFDSNRASYDYLNREVIRESSGMHIFRTGEAAFNYVQPDPEHRRHSEKYKINVFATDKIPYVLKDLSGKHIINAWLQQSGLQYLLADETTNLIVALSKSLARTQHTLQIPIDFRQYAAYWPRTESKVLGSPIIISEQYKPTDEYKKFIKELILSAKLLEATTNNPKNSQYQTTPIKIILENMAIGRTPQQMLLTLPNYYVKSLSLGMIATRYVYEVDYLTWSIK